MLHENLKRPGPVDELDIAAVWPNATPGPDLIAGTADTVARPAASTPDVPAAAGALIVLAYIALLATLALATVAPGPSLFVIGICAFFAFMFFAVPATFLKIEKADGGRVGMGQFLRSGMRTNTGHCTGGAALTQMLIVPVALTFGVLCMGLAFIWIV